MQQATADREGRFADPARLRAERDSLAVYLVGQSNLASENLRLRTLLGLRERVPYSFVPAEIKRLGGIDQRGAFFLTAGARQGVQPGYTIIAAGGLVGQVRDSDPGMAHGIDWTHTDFRASAMTTDGETYGIVEPRTTRAGEQVLALTGTAAHTELRPGTLIVTSGQGGVYPRGIPIGRVLQTEKDDQATDWRRSYLLRPLVSPTAMDYVLVLGPLAPGRSEDDLASSWGIRAEEPKTTPEPGAFPAQMPQPQPALPAPRAAAPAARPAPALPQVQLPVQSQVPAQAQAPAVTRTPATTPAPRPAPPPAARPRPATPPLLGTPVPTPPDTTPRT
ncbi:MAG: hypothetical protein H0V06_02675 [Gemmatimonadetes bacterium]|nr:hypothetical protein [Gemmatimonadota bacterium]